MPKNCLKCGEAFSGGPVNKIYCSLKCQRAAELERKYGPVCVCPGCGETFQAKNNQRAGYCSRECAYKHIDQWHGRATNKTCKTCGSQYRIGFSNDYCSQKCRDTAFKSVCSICGKGFVGVDPRQHICSDDCRAEYNRQRATENDKKKFEALNKVCVCKTCGAGFKPEYGTKKRSFCSDDCARKAENKARRKRQKETGATHQQRAKHYGVPRGYFNLRKILERDNWRCYICGRDTPEELRGTYEDNAPEIDHVIPLSKGGGHTKDNVRCCCRRCNAEKSNEIYTPRQLNLLGGHHA